MELISCKTMGNNGLLSKQWVNMFFLQQVNAQEKFISFKTMRKKIFLTARKFANLIVFV